MPKHGDSKQLAASARKARARNLRLIRIFILVIVIAAVFCLGFFVRGNATVLSALGFTALVGDDPAKTVEQRTVYNSLSERVEEVEDTLSEESLDTFDLDQTTTGVLNALATATEDPYLRYYDQAQYALLEQNAGDDYEGVGVLFGESDGKAYAVDVFDDSPAQIAGVQQGDFVVAIDGDRTREWSQTEVLAALDREEGSTAVITWRRPATSGAEGGEEFTTALTCVKTSETNVASVLRPRHPRRPGRLPVPGGRDRQPLRPQRHHRPDRDQRRHQHAPGKRRGRHRQAAGGPRERQHDRRGRGARLGASGQPARDARRPDHHG